VSTSDGSIPARLRELRKGPGLLGTGLAGRIDRQLAGFCGVLETDDDDAIRSKIAAAVRGLLQDAPESDRTAVAVALGIEPGAQQLTVTGRRDWLAGREDRDSRTVRRQEERGFDLIASMLAGEAFAVAPPRSAPPWRVQAFRAILLLDRPAPRLFEERTIVAGENGLSEITLSVSAPAADDPQAPPITAEVLHGGVIVRTDHRAPSHSRFGLRLPRPLRAGEAHHYGVLFDVPPERRLRPHYAFLPLQQCESFQLIVKFGVDALPRRCWRLHRAAPRVIDDAVPTEEPLTPDAVGELRTGFRHLHQGLGYGVGWLPS
jgi:hypothetical protein